MTIGANACPFFFLQFLNLNQIRFVESKKLDLERFSSTPFHVVAICTQCYENLGSVSQFSTYLLLEFALICESTASIEQPTQVDLAKWHVPNR